MNSWPPMEQRGPAVTEADVRRFEQRLVAKLPDDYRRFLLDLNGGRTAETHCTFTMRRFERRAGSVLNVLYSLNHPDQSFNLATQQLYGEADDRLRDGLEVGADDGGGSIVLALAGPHRGEVWMLDRVDPRPTGSNPRVEWFDRRDVWKLADNFAEFMGNLRPLEDSASASP
jgi:cell wall assembly regulator SMI1